MARSKKNNSVEQVELKPQVIGYAYKKKSNFGRVIFIFIIFVLVVYFINDISVFVNDLFGKNTVQSIKQLADEEETIIDKVIDKNTEKQEIKYYSASNDLEITLDGLLLNNFNFNNYNLTFDVTNSTSQDIDLSNHKYFIEIFNDNKTLLNRYKLDINKINAGNKTSYSFEMNSSFSYFTIEEKKVSDYPNVDLTEDENNLATITCSKNSENIVYTFLNGELIKINHTIEEDSSNNNYLNDYYEYKNKIASYSNINGVIASFTEINNGFKASVNVDFANLNSGSINEKYYFNYKELAKVVDFEMQTYGYTCK